jgi:hypothetical protein
VSFQQSQGFPPDDQVRLRNCYRKHHLKTLNDDNNKSEEIEAKEDISLKRNVKPLPL